MRLLQAMAGGPQGGAEAFFERLAAAFARRGLAQRLLIRRDAARAHRLRAVGLDVVELPFRRLFDFITRRRFTREIEAFRPDVVLTWMSRASAACPRATLTRPFVHAARLGGYYDLKYYRNARHLIGNTEGIVRYLVRSGWPEAHAHYLPNFAEAARMAAMPRSALTTPEHAPLLLALGRLHRNKAFDVLIRALGELPRAWLWLAGEGPERSALERLAATEGVAERARFLGWREDAPALFAASDVVVCPSRHEPLGNVVIEAWAHGKPVVAAASEGPSELIRDGIDGLLVPLEDAVALAQAIRRVLGEPALAARLVAEGECAYRARFTEAAVVARYLEFFESIAPCAASPG